MTDTVKWCGRRYAVGCGFDPAGRVREVFLSGYRVGSELDSLLDDACVLVSIMLQGGWRPEELARHLGRQSVMPDAPAASLWRTDKPSWLTSIGTGTLPSMVKVARLTGRSRRRSHSMWAPSGTVRVMASMVSGGLFM